MKLSGLHTTTIDEDWKSWARNAALGATLAGGALGAFGASKPTSSPATAVSKSTTQAIDTDGIMQTYNAAAPADRPAMAKQIIQKLSAAADNLEQSDPQTALKYLTTASRVAQSSNLNNKYLQARIEDLTEINNNLATAAKLSDAAKTSLAAREQLIRHYLINLNNPKAAQALETSNISKQLARVIELANKPVNKLDSQELLLMAKWYADGNTISALETAKDYADRYAKSGDAQSIQAVPLLDKINKPLNKLYVIHTMKAIDGNWDIKYTNHTKRTYIIKDNIVNYGKSRAKLQPLDDGLLLNFDDGRIEKLLVNKDGTLHVDHYYPNTSYPVGKPYATGIGQRID